MKAMLSTRPGEPLTLTQMRVPSIGNDEVLVKVLACGVCRTDLHIMDGDLPQATYPIIPGHEVIGEVIEIGSAVSRWKLGDRVGVGWLAYTCGRCKFCLAGKENLCDSALFNGCHRHGGFAEFMATHADYCYPIDPKLSPSSAAPLMCAGLIGNRALNIAGECDTLGLYGFGAAAHIVLQVATRQGKSVCVFTRPDDVEAQDFARSLGAAWAGASTEHPPCHMEAAIIFAPVGDLVPQSLATLDKGGRVVCAGIHMSDIPQFPYSLLWGERQIRSVANLTREDAHAFLALTDSMPIATHITTFPLHEANRALQALRDGDLKGAAVLVP